jgi:hypothetical protein
MRSLNQKRHIMSYLMLRRMQLLEKVLPPGTVARMGPKERQKNIQQAGLPDGHLL